MTEDTKAPVPEQAHLNELRKSVSDFGESLTRESQGSLRPSYLQQPQNLAIPPAAPSQEQTSTANVPTNTGQTTPTEG
jgi:hypothetical protein